MARLRKANAASTPETGAKPKGDSLASTATGSRSCGEIVREHADGGDGGNDVKRIALVALVALATAVPLAGAHGIDQLSSADLPSPAIEDLVKVPLPDFPAPAPVRAAPPEPPGGSLPSPGSFEQLGHNPLMNRGMNAALAVRGDFAYIGSRTDGSHLNAGVLVVNVADPAKPRVVSEIGLPNQANPGESSRELRIWPEQELLLVLNHGCSELIHRCASPSLTGMSEAPSTIKFYDIAGANAASPKLVSTYRPSRQGPQQPHEFFLWTDPQRPDRTLVYLSTPSTDGGTRPQLVVTDISKARTNEFREIGTFTTRIGNPERDNRMHSLTVSADGRTAYLAYLGGGFLVLDVSDFADDREKPEARLITPVNQRVFWTNPGAHSAVRVPGRDFALVTDEVYGKFGGVLAEHGCPWGFVRMIDIKDQARPRIAAEYRLRVNQPEICRSISQDRDNFSSFASHNPTLTNNLALITWHSAGLQAVNLENPEQPSSAAQFIPEPLSSVQTEDPALSQGPDKVVMWSFPIIQNGLIYVVDLRNGLYILRYRGPFEQEVSAAKFLDGNSNSGDQARLEATKPVAGAAPPAGAPPAGAPPAGQGSPVCLPRPLALTRGGLGPLRLGRARADVARAAAPQRQAARALRYCVERQGRAYAAFDRAARARLVVTTAEGADGLSGASGVSRGMSLRAARRALRGERSAGRGLFVVRSTGLVFGARRGRVRFVGVADRRALRSPAILRALVRSVRL